MPKSLIITEKPSVARDIVEAIGGFRDTDEGYWESDQYVCTFAVGHVLEFLGPEEIDPVYKRWTLDTLPIIPEKFQLKPKSGQTDRIRTIKKLIQRADIETLINACDAGREGELIFREIVKHIGSTKPIRRLWLQSMTTQAIRDGFAHLEDGRKFEGLAAAAECRSTADWLIGMNATRAMTIRMRSKSHPGAWSAGRVQTPTLALLVERENEILKHVPQPYWRVLANFAVSNQTYGGTWFDPNYKENEAQPEGKADRIFDEAKAGAIVSDVLGKTGRASETRKPSREAAPPLFDLTSLQREANRRFGWSAARTLQSAQRCYEAHKALTYPRTSSRCLPSDYVPEVEKVLRTFSAGSPYQASARYLLTNGRQNDAKIFNDKGVSDHFAIIPTGLLSRSLQGDDAKLFDLVVRRFLGAFFPPAIWEQVERRTVVEGHHFQSRARTLKEPGWRAVLDQTSDEGEGKGLAPLIPGQDKADDVPATTQEAQAETDATKPPPRITEARLLSLMENAGKQVEDEDLAAALSEKGLGTPATRADIIENLKSKDYVDRNLRPTVKGMRFIDLLGRINASRLTSAELTGELELHLNEVEHGDRQAQQFMGEIIDYTKEIVDAVRGFEYDEVYPDRDPLGICPCGKNRPVYERAWFYRCKEDPAEVAAGTDCEFRIWKDKSGRYIDRQTVTTLLRDGKTGELTGFSDRRGRTFNGVLAIQDMQVILQPVAGTEQQGESTVVEFPVNPEPLGLCPVHKTEGDMVVETSLDFICQERQRQIATHEKKPTGFVLPRVVCKREITREEAIAYMAAGETPFIEDFISRYGKPFKAKLTIKADGKHQFEFMPREKKGGFKKAGGKAGAEADGEGKKPAKKKAKAKTATAKPPAARKTTAVKKAATKKTAVKKVKKA